jgi:PhnB protein
MQITQVNPHLHFSGQCETAFKFYEQCFGGKIEYMSTHAGTPVETHVAPEWRNKILHAALRVGGGILMGCDVPPDHYQKPKGFSVSLQMKDRAEAERVFNALAEEGSVQMQFQQTFWSQGFGMLVDRFGIPWMVNSEQPS